VRNIASEGGLAHVAAALVTLAALRAVVGVAAAVRGLCTDARCAGVYGFGRGGGGAWGRCSCSYSNIE
jgi:hypothetical protein